jgi:hypothetical protein
MKMREIEATAAAMRAANHRTMNIREHMVLQHLDADLMCLVLMGYLEVEDETDVPRFRLRGSEGR